jgi:hypothetical protein
LACITVKFQKCGKKNCKCYNGHLHGPYYWLITYKKYNSTKKGKYIWIYLGKDGNTVEQRIKLQNFTKKWDKINWENFHKKLESLEIKQNMDDSKNYKIDLNQEK